MSATSTVSYRVAHDCLLALLNAENARMALAFLGGYMHQADLHGIGLSPGQVQALSERIAEWLAKAPTSSASTNPLEKQS